MLRQFVAEGDEDAVPAFGKFGELCDVPRGDGVGGSIYRLPKAACGDKKRPEFRITRLFRQQQ
jgi:hypothetical protein